MTQHCGFVAVVGAPNAGKSTIVNALVGQKVAIVSPKAQTTRTRLMGVAMEGETQIVLIDTPGIFAPTRRLDRAMVAAAWSSLEEAEAILVMVDAAAKLTGRVERVLEGIANRPEKKYLILNKVDLTKKDKLLAIATELNGRAPFDETFFVSASSGDGVPELKAQLAKLMPEGPWHFPEDEVSNAPERMLAAEITREQLYRQLHEELPYQSTVETEKFTNRPDGSAEIHQQILVARDNQRAIILGHKGERIKEIGSRARAELTELLGRKVHLFLHVKVKANWDEDRSVYRDMGLDWVD
ncbi:GTP-binding protein Era [Sphingopyxis italica]|uniref:GTPase Era n=1 Tax=Sphingopyxis italica TaxID=1129133 RepID=A0A7X5XRP9_9SPHN|nr:GTPase Era [Sphingopyxis italica]NJB89713.1 GTP-binding protein Era [Sphingopyxis italica]